MPKCFLKIIDEIARTVVSASIKLPKIIQLIQLSVMLDFPYAQIIVIRPKRIVIIKICTPTKK